MWALAARRPGLYRPLLRAGVALLGLLDEGWTVGDLGCGTGQVTGSLAPFVGRVIAVDDSPEMLEALLGILKAGGGYLPLDPTYPRERLALLLADAAPAAVVGPRHLLAALPDVPNGAPRLAFEDTLAEADVRLLSTTRRRSSLP